MTDICDYCNKWNRDHPGEKQRDSCGPCVVCQAPGHLGAHPRQPTSICLCKNHWDDLNSPGYHFEFYHLIYAAILSIAAVQIYPIIARLWNG